MDGNCPAQYPEDQLTINVYVPRDKWHLTTKPVNGEPRVGWFRAEKAVLEQCPVECWLVAWTAGEE